MTRSARFRAWIKAHIGSISLMVVLAFLVLYPLARIQILAMEDGGAAYARAVRLPGIGETLLTTLALGLGSLLISLVLGTGLAWLSMRLPRRYSWLSVVPVLPVIVPAVAVVVGWAFLLSPQVGYINIALRAIPGIDVPTTALGQQIGPINIYSVPAIIAITGIQVTPLVYLFTQSGLSQLNFETIEAAAVSGAKPVSAFLKVVVPLLRPALIYSIAFGLLIGLGQFTAPQFLGAREGVKVLSTEIYRFAGEEQDYAMAAAVASPMLIIGILFILFQRSLLGKNFRFVSSGGKGHRSLRPSRLAAPAILVFAFVALVLPLIAIVLVAFSPYWTGRIDFSTFTTENMVEALNTPAVLDATRTSVGTALATILIALPIGYALAEILYRRRGGTFTRGVLDGIVQVPLGIPATVFGVGFLYVYTRGPLVLYGTPLVIVLTYIAIVLPFATRTQLAARMSTGVVFEEAARVSGASMIKAHLKVTIPMIRGALGGAAVLLFVILTHEFAASLFVRSTQTQVLGTLLNAQWTTGSYPLVAATGLIMSAITATGVIVAMAIGGRQALSEL